MSQNKSLPYGKGIAHPLMLEIRERTGDVWAFAYLGLESMSHNRSRGVRMQFPSHHVLVEGRNLEKLFQGLIQHETAWIEEQDSRYDDSPENDPFIDRVQVISLDEDAPHSGTAEHTKNS